MINVIDKNYLSGSFSNQLKGFAIILVMVGHLWLIYFSAAWGTAIFLLISGFGLTQSYYKSGLTNYFKKRVLKVIVPYSMVTLIWFMIDSFIYNINNNKVDIVLSLLGINVRCIFDLSMWYITFILIWYVAFYIVFRIVNNEAIRILLLFAFSIFLYKAVAFFPVNVGVPRYVIEFPIGVLLGILYKRIQGLNTNIVLKIHSLITVICFMLFFYFYKNQFTPYTELYLCMFFAISAVSFFGALSIFKVKLMFLEFIGKISYEIYLFEYVFIEKYKFIFNLEFNSWLNILIYFIIVILLALLLKSCLSFLDKFLLKLVGSKKI